MSGKPKKGQREKDLTSRYLSGSFDEDLADPRQQFSARNKNRQQEKTLKTALMRLEEQTGVDLESLPIAQVVQVHSLYCDVMVGEKVYLAVVRRTLTKVASGYVVVGDRVRIRPAPEIQGAIDGAARKDLPAAVIEQILPRQTILTRADSFKGVEQHPIVANAEQMLIVASLRQPRIKWGLIDRMLVAALAGQLRPIICLNKMDLIEPGDEQDKDVVQADLALAHYQTLGAITLRTSVERKIGLSDLSERLHGRETVLAGHSGVGKSSLINAIEPTLNLRVGEVSGYTEKGRHTTTSARRYPLSAGGAVIDTPGVKLFGLWGVSAENLSDYFPDVASGSAPPWRQESYGRIMESLGGEYEG